MSKTANLLIETPVDMMKHEKADILYIGFISSKVQLKKEVND